MKIKELFIKWVISYEMKGFNFNSLFTAPVLVFYLPTYSDIFLQMGRKGARLLEASFTSEFSMVSVACYYLVFTFITFTLLYLYSLVCYFHYIEELLCLNILVLF